MPVRSSSPHSKRTEYFTSTLVSSQRSRIFSLLRESGAALAVALRSQTASPRPLAVDFNAAAASFTSAVRRGRHFGGVGGDAQGAGLKGTAPPLGARPPAPRRAGKMAVAGRAWRAAALLPPWRLRAPRRDYSAAAAAATAAGGGGGRLLLGAAFALGGGAGLYLAARHRLREHSAAEVTRRRAPLAA